MPGQGHALAFERISNPVPRQASLSHALTGPGSPIATARRFAACSRHGRASVRLPFTSRIRSRPMHGRAPGQARYLRERTGDEARVTNIELFFDLVYAFAVTQLSHPLVGALSIYGALQTLVLWFAVWLGWQYT